MTNWAVFVFDPGSMAAWVIVGIVAGLLFVQLKGAPGYGVIGDLILGALGGLVCGVVFSFFGEGSPSFWSSSFVALVGAFILIASVRVINGRLNA